MIDAWRQYMDASQSPEFCNLDLRETENTCGVTQAPRAAPEAVPNMDHGRQQAGLLLRSGTCLWRVFFPRSHTAAVAARVLQGHLSRCGDGHRPHHPLHHIGSSKSGSSKSGFPTAGWITRLRLEPAKHSSLPRRTGLVRRAKPRRAVHIIVYVLQQSVGWRRGCRPHHSSRGEHVVGARHQRVRLVLRCLHPRHDAGRHPRDIASSVPPHPAPPRPRRYIGSQH